MFFGAEMTPPLGSLSEGLFRQQGLPRLRGGGWLKRPNRWRLAISSVQRVISLRFYYIFKMRTRFKESLAKSLKQHFSNPQSSNQQALLSNKYNQLYVRHIRTLDPSYSTVPIFYRQIPLKLRSRGKQIFSQHLKNIIPSKNQVQKACNLIKRNISPPLDGTLSINFESLQKLLSSLPDKFKQILTATFFASFQRDKFNRVDVQVLSQGLLKRVSLQSLIPQILTYQETGHMYLSSKGLKSYLQERIKTLKGHEALDPSFVNYYVGICLTKFRLNVDPHKRDKFFTRKLVLSDQFFQFNRMFSQETSPTADNLFSIDRVNQILSLYLQLAHQAGGITLKNIQELGWQMPSVIARWLIQQYGRQGLLGLQDFAELVFAMESKQCEGSIWYLLRATDRQKQQTLTSKTIREILRSAWQKIGSQVDLDSQHLLNQLFDMIGVDDDRVKISRIVQSGVGGQVVRMLFSTREMAEWAQKQT